MSNEPQSPLPLRLKPRLSSGQAVTSTENPADSAPAPTRVQAPLPASPLPAQPVPAPLPSITPAPLPPERVPAPISSKPVPAPAADDPGKFKLKPRTAPSAGNATPPAASSAITAPASIAAPTSAPANAPALASPGPQLTLKIAPVAPAVSSSTAAASETAPPLVLKPSLPAAVLASPAFAKPAVPVSGRPNMPIAPLLSSVPVLSSARTPIPNGSEKKEKQKPGKNAVKLLLALLFVAAGVFGVMGYNTWFAGDPEPVAPPVVTRPAAKPANAPAENLAAEKPAETASDVVAQPAVVAESPDSLPGNVIAKAKEAIAANNTALVDPINEILTPATAPVSKPPVENPAATPPPAANTSPAQEPASTAKIATTSAPAVPTPAPAPDPSPAFRSYVVNLRISGVFQGESARAMLNGKMYRLGETVDSKLGIIFLRLEPENKRIVFEDGRGAIMSRRY